MAPTIVIRSEMSAYDRTINACPEFFVKAQPFADFSRQRHPELWDVACSSFPLDKPERIEARMSPKRLLDFCRNAIRLFGQNLRIAVEHANISEPRSFDEICTSLEVASFWEAKNLDIEKSTPGLKGLKSTAQLIASVVLVILLGIPALFWEKGRVFWKESVHQLCWGAVHLRNAVATSLGFQQRPAPQRWFPITL